MIIATAGHVDHGKTSLVRALTGVDTDRLPEEKKRKLTIDLGFAYLPIDDELTIGFVDVPGHERFIRNALCGLAGADFVLFVVAADDGPMPQTREHLAIASLMGISKGAIALTKIDRVEADWLEVVRDEVADLFSRTALRNAPLFPVSAETGEGFAALSAHLSQAARTTELRPSNGRFRLAVDRAFNVVGTGLVVTGTVFSGHVSVGDAVQLAGHDMRMRIRGLHAQNAEAATARAGQRCALNLSGTELRKSEVSRGRWVVCEDVAAPVRKFDARIQVVPDLARALAHWTPVHVHLGAAETTGRIALLEDTKTEPGGSALAQITVDEPIGAVFGDRLILRDQSAQFTFGGGRVLDIHPPRRGRARPERIAILKVSECSDTTEALSALLGASDAGVRIDRFAENRNLTEAERAEVERRCEFQVVNDDAGRIAFSSQVWDGLRSQVFDQLGSRHSGSASGSAASGRNSSGRIELVGRNGRPLSRKLTSIIVDTLVAEGALVRDADGLRLAGQKPKLDGKDAAIWEQVSEVFENSGLRPLTPREIAAQLEMEHISMERFLARAARQGLVAQISKNRFSTLGALRALAGLAEDVAANAPEGLLSVIAFRDQTGVGRNMAIEILEHFDRRRFTQRVGDGREICQPADKVFPSS
ncbi:MAG: selenocysteine-specific translation elongation factor [Pseudomonadota bacterium]